MPYAPQIFVFRNPTCQNVSSINQHFKNSHYCFMLGSPTQIRTRAAKEPPEIMKVMTSETVAGFHRSVPNSPENGFKLIQKKTTQEADISQCFTRLLKSLTLRVASSSCYHSHLLQVPHNSCSPVVSGQFDNLLPSWVGHHLRSVLSLVDGAELEIRAFIQQNHTSTFRSPQLSTRHLCH